MKEIDLYKPMCKWLKKYLSDRYKNDVEIITLDTHNERLDKVLEKNNIYNDLAIGVDIQIDVLGIVKYKKTHKLFFIEAKKSKLTLKDLGQLLVYCKLINPEEAFLLTPDSFGSLDKILKVYRREDLLEYGNDKRVIKRIKVGLWDIAKESPDMLTIIPQL